MLHYDSINTMKHIQAYFWAINKINKNTFKYYFIITSILFISIVYVHTCFYKAYGKSGWASLVAQVVKNLPAMQETWVWFLGQEDPLEEGMATLSSIPAWRIPWTEEPGRLQCIGLQRVGHNWMTNTMSVYVLGKKKRTHIVGISVHFSYSQSP